MQLTAKTAAVAITKTKPVALTPQNTSSVLQLTSLGSSPLNSLYQSLHSVFSPLLLRWTMLYGLCVVVESCFLMLIFKCVYQRCKTKSASENTEYFGGAWYGLGLSHSTICCSVISTDVYCVVSQGCWKWHQFEHCQAFWWSTVLERSSQCGKQSKRSRSSFLFQRYVERDHQWFWYHRVRNEAMRTEAMYLSYLLINTSNFIIVAICRHRNASMYWTELRTCWTKSGTAKT